MANNGISCSVCECHFHENGDKCSAENVTVGGSNKCCASCDTECVTFKPQEK